MDTLMIRPASDRDTPPLADLLNEIIARGGTTAYQEGFTPETLAQELLMGPQVICCFVAGGDDHQLYGFQSVLRSDDLPNGVGSIGTFARAGVTQKGIGSQLFAATRRAAVESGLTELDATIRADNLGGLAFYTRLGFVDFGVSPAIPLRDGALVDRISKRFVLIP